MKMYWNDTTEILIKNGIVVGVNVGNLDGIGEMPLDHDVESYMDEIKILDILGQEYESIKTDYDETVHYELHGEFFTREQRSELNIHPFYKRNYTN